MKECKRLNPKGWEAGHLALTSGYCFFKLKKTRLSSWVLNIYLSLLSTLVVWFTPMSTSKVLAIWVGLCQWHKQHPQHSRSGAKQKRLSIFSTKWTASMNERSQRGNEWSRRVKVQWTFKWENHDSGRAAEHSNEWTASGWWGIDPKGWTNDPKG